MRIKNKILLLLSCLLLGGFTCIQAENESTKEELIQKLATYGHDTLKLKALCEIVDICKPEPKLRKQYTDDLLKEAEFQNNNYYKCKAYLYYIYMSFNANDPKELQKWLDLMVPLAQKEKHYDLMFQAKQCAIDLLILHESQEEMGVKAQDMLREAQALNNKRGIILAYQSIARAYRYSFRVQQAAEMLEKAYALSIELHDYTQSNDLNNSLIAVYSSLKSYPDLLRSIQERERVINIMLRKQPESRLALQFDFFYLYISYSEYYLAMNDIQKAQKYIALTDRYYSGKYIINVVRYHEMKKKYFIDTRQWEKAITHIDSLLTVYRKVEYTYYNEAMFDKAKVLSNMGNYTDALPLYEKALTDNDSISMSVYDKQVDYLKEMQSIEKKQLQTLRLHHYVSISVLILIAIIVAILVVFFFFYYRINRKLNKSEKEMRRIAREVDKVNKVKETFISNMNNAISQPLNEVVDYSVALASDKVFVANEKEKAAEKISITATGLSQLINDILDLSRLEAGMMRFQVADISFTTYLQETIGIALTNYPIQVDNKLDPNLNYLISFDGSWLYRLMHTLLVPIDNATDKSLSISIEENTENREVVLTIHNSILVTSSSNQNILIQNEINRMLIEHFGGRWENTPNLIKFTIPFLSKTLIS